MAPTPHGAARCGATSPASASSVSLRAGGQTGFRDVLGGMRRCAASSASVERSRATGHGTRIRRRPRFNAVERLSVRANSPTSRLHRVIGPERRRQAGSAAPVQVHVVFPRVADRAEHQQRVEHQVGRGERPPSGRRTPQRAGAARRDSSAARTASQAAAAASSALTSSIAALCCSAWNAPTGLPNCSRVRMYSVAASAQRRTVPADAHAANATTMQRARSASIPDNSALAPTAWSATLQHTDVGAQVGAVLLFDR